MAVFVQDGGDSALGARPHRYSEAGDFVNPLNVWSLAIGFTIWFWSWYPAELSLTAIGGTGNKTVNVDSTTWPN